MDFQIGRAQDLFVRAFLWVTEIDVGLQMVVGIHLACLCVRVFVKEPRSLAIVWIPTPPCLMTSASRKERRGWQRKESSAAASA